MWKKDLKLGKAAVARPTGLGSEQLGLVGRVVFPFQASRKALKSSSFRKQRTPLFTVEAGEIA